MKRLIGIVIALLVLVSPGCAKAQHITVQADYAFAKSVFAFDDAELALCTEGTLTAEQCATLNPVVKQLLLDVKAVTLALQAAPKDLKVPTSLSDLLSHMTDVQRLLMPLARAGGKLGDLALKLDTAISQAIKVIDVFAGGAVLDDQGRYVVGGRQ